MVIIIYHPFQNYQNFNGKMQLIRSNSVWFFQDNHAHRYFGPAFFKKSNNYKEWWFHSKHYGSSNFKYNQKLFLKDLNKQWLI